MFKDTNDEQEAGRIDGRDYAPGESPHDPDSDQSLSARHARRQRDQSRLRPTMGEGVVCRPSTTGRDASLTETLAHETSFT